MNKITVLILSAVLITVAASGQSSLHYNFNNNLSESTGSGPVLAPLGTQGVFVLDTLNEISGKTKTVYRFEYNCGLQLDNQAAGNFIGETYSIELYFVFDNLTSWKRVVDWKNRKTDNGAYVYYGELNFYDYIYSTEAPVLPGEYTYYVITRDGASKKLMIYTDAKVEIDFTDSNDEGILDADHVLNFFYDDLVVPGEASPGAVALLNLYNYVLDSNSIKQKFTDLNGQIFAVDEHGNGQGALQAWPNPASGRISVGLDVLKTGGDVEVRLINTLGTVVVSATVPAGKSSVEFATEDLPGGIYLVNARSSTGMASQKVVIRH